MGSASRRGSLRPGEAPAEGGGRRPSRSDGRRPSKMMEARYTFYSTLLQHVASTLLLESQRKMLHRATNNNITMAGDMDDAEGDGDYSDEDADDDESSD